MEDIDFSPLKDTVNNIALQLVIWMGICSGTYIVAYIILRMFKVPNKIANTISAIIFLIALYYSIVNGFIPGIQGTQ